MTVLSPGANAPLPAGDLTLLIRHGTIAEVEIDVSAFLVTGTGKVRSDADMCFYGQPSIAGGAVVLAGTSGGETKFTVAPSRIPAGIERVILTATIHENRAAFGRLPEIGLEVGGVIGRIPCAGMTETALILAELYQRNGAWKVRVVGQGFNGGLAKLAPHLGVEVDASPFEVVQPSSSQSSALISPKASARVSLEKRVEAEAPHLVSLAKKATVSLEKQKLEGIKARVGLVLDASGSMYSQYVHGRVQDVVDRVLPLAVYFDDDGELDTWAFAERSQKLKPVTLKTVRDYVSTEASGWEGWMRRLNAAINYEPAVMRDVIKHFGGELAKEGTKGLFSGLWGAKPAAETVPKPVLPAYVIFISDGGVGSDAEIEQLVRESARLPIFWQFVGIGGSNYGILEHLDGLHGRIVDNCNFFALDDLYSISDQELYDRLLGEFPVWLNAAKKAGIIP